MDLSDLGHWKKANNIEEFGKFDGDYFGMVYKITLPNGFW